MRTFSTSKRAKIMAFAAAGLILGVGGTVTLAAWVDNEWVFGGGANGEGPGVGTSEFVVEQNRSKPFINDPGSWQNFPDNPGGSLVFGPGALALTPGDTVFAPVALRTTPDTDVAGNAVIQPAIAAAGITVDDPDDLLWDVLELQVGVVSVASGGVAPTCNADLTGYTTIANGTGLDTTFTDDTEPLVAAGATFVHYCFVITLPEISDIDFPDGTDAEDLMGRTVAPAWEFISTSV